jgi:hypothetical protein
MVFVVADSSSAGEPQLFGVVNDLIEQRPNRLAIPRDNGQLIAKGIGRRVERHRILRTSTP